MGEANVPWTLWTSVRGEASCAAYITWRSHVRCGISRRALANSLTPRCRAGEDRPGSNGDEPARLRLLPVLTQFADGPRVGCGNRRRLLHVASLRTRRLGAGAACSKSLVSRCADAPPGSSDLAGKLESKSWLGMVEFSCYHL